MRQLTLILLFVLLSLSVTVVAAQEETPEPESIGDGEPLVYGEVASARLDNTTPRRLYYFDALRGDYLTVRVRATGGNLDPVLVLLDSNGSPIASRDDTNGTRGASVQQTLITRSDRYYVVVARFGYALGTTAGDFELIVERVGNSSESGSAMRYGDTVLNDITGAEPAVYYSFPARQGDIVNLRMRKLYGDLDPLVQIVGPDLTLLEEVDDDPFAAPDAYIDGFLIPEDGTYYIVATRYGYEAGTSSGTFTLTLEEAANSGLGNTPQAAQPVALGASVEGEITADNWVRYYRFEAQRDDIITVSMSRYQEGRVDSWLEIANAGLQTLILDDDTGGGWSNQDALISEYRIPADGTYYIIATRYEKENGTTTGRYLLEIDYEGNAFDGVPPDVARIGYGLSVTGSIDDVTPETLYAFWGEQGDTITASLSRGDGDLQPVVSVLDAGLSSLTSDASDGPLARVSGYVLPYTGVYYLRATRRGGEGIPPTSGSYILVLAGVPTVDGE